MSCLLSSQTCLPTCLPACLLALPCLALPCLRLPCLALQLQLHSGHKELGLGLGLGTCGVAWLRLRARATTNITRAPRCSPQIEAPRIEEPFTKLWVSVMELSSTTQEIQEGYISPNIRPTCRVFLCNHRHARSVCLGFPSKHPHQRAYHRLQTSSRVHLSSRRFRDQGVRSCCTRCCSSTWAKRKEAILLIFHDVYIAAAKAGRCLREAV